MAIRQRSEEKTIRVRIPLVGALWACSAAVACGQTGEPAWVKVTDHAAWAPRDSCGELVYKGKLWLLGGWFTSNATGPRDVWCSADGADWDRITEKAAWTHGDLPTTLVYKDKMWFMGGWYGGRMSVASASNEVWSSTDGANWHRATAKAPWPARLGAGGVVFAGKMWILGGSERYFDDDKRLLNDVWHSTDGVHWQPATRKAPWAPRAYHGAVVFDNKIWIFGGGNYRPTYLGYNDVWCSSDGVGWRKVTDHAAWPHRIWFSSVVYRNRLWVLGGLSDKPSKNWNDVWYTTDGATWTALTTKTVWSPRHEQSAYVFADKLWIVGGNPWPLVNDVWHLDLEKQGSATAPARK